MAEAVVTDLKFVEFSADGTLVCQRSDDEVYAGCRIDNGNVVLGRRLERLDDEQAMPDRFVHSAVHMFQFGDYFQVLGFFGNDQYNYLQLERLPIRLENGNTFYVVSSMQEGTTFIIGEDSNQRELMQPVRINQHTRRLCWSQSSLYLASYGEVIIFDFESAALLPERMVARDEFIHISVTTDDARFVTVDEGVIMQTNMRVYTGLELATSNLFDAAIQTACFDHRNGLLLCTTAEWTYFPPQQGAI